MDIGISNMLNTQLAYCIVNGSYIPVAAMLDTEIEDENCYKQAQETFKMRLTIATSILGEASKKKLKYLRN